MYKIDSRGLTLNELLHYADLGLLKEPENVENIAHRTLWYKKKLERENKELQAEMNRMETGNFYLTSSWSKHG